MTRLLRPSPARPLPAAAVLLALLAAVAPATTPPEELPLPADRVMMLPDNAGEEIGLPLGATRAYALGRSLQKRGQTEAALQYLNRAYRMASDSGRIARAYAQSLVEAGFVGDAARIYGKLLEQTDATSDDRRHHAMLLAESGRPRSALEAVREIRASGEEDPRLIELEADLLGDLGRVDQAIAVYREARRADPARAEEYTLAAGALLQEHERFEEMAELLREGLAEDATSERMRVALVRFLLHERRLNEARVQAAEGDQARRAAGVGTRPAISLELAEMLARRGDYTAAAEVLTGIRERGFRDREAEAQLARYRLGLGEVEAALALLPEAAARWDQDAELRYLWGRALEMQDDIAGARRRLVEAVERAPSMPVYRIGLLRTLVLHHRADLGAGQPDPEQSTLQDLAREHVQKAAVTVHQQDSDGHMIIAYTYRALGDLERACRHFQMASEMQDNRLGALLELAFCQQEAGQMSEARKTLTNLRHEYPEDPEVANSYGYFLAEVGEDLDLAERLVKQALAAEPDNGAYLDSLGWVYFQQGDYAAAFDWLVRAANERPDDPVILEHLGRTLARLDQPQRAREVLRRALDAGGDPSVLEPLIAELPGER
jgi:tetratricopeptide (TPR) repeat protein